MEFQVNQIKDTRERITMKHIKSLDIVQREIDKIMPNELSEQLDDKFDIEIVKKDLESEDVFSMAFRND